MPSHRTGRGFINVANLPLPASYCAGDLNGDFVIDVLDLLILLAAWGPSPGMAGSVMSLSERLDAAGLTQQNWNDFQAVMMGDASARTKANWKCWMENYLTQCVNCPLCPGVDPFAD